MSGWQRWSCLLSLSALALGAGYRLVGWIFFFQAADGPRDGRNLSVVLQGLQPMGKHFRQVQGPTVPRGQLDAQVLEVGGGARPARVRQPGKTTPADRRRRFGASRLPNTPQGSEMRVPIYGSNP